MREWYNGYAWLGEEKVYNPYDVLKLLRHREFGNYWFETGSPRFLIDVLAERGVPSAALDRTVADTELLSAFDVDHIAAEALLFQSGYLTVTGAQRRHGEMLYELGYPNREVRQSLNRALLRWMLGDSAYRPVNAVRLRSLLGDGDARGVRALLESLYASIPHQWHTRNGTARFEGYYASVFYSCFAASGVDVAAEDRSSRGRVDMTVRTPQRVWLFEFKIAEASKPGEGLRQMRARGYADKHRSDGVEVMYLRWVEGPHLAAPLRRRGGDTRSRGLQPQDPQHRRLRDSHRLNDGRRSETQRDSTAAAVQAGDSERRPGPARSRPRPAESA